jgi:Fe-S-cluster containining protein
MRQYITIGSRGRGMIRCRCALTKEEFQVQVSSYDAALMNDPALLFKNPKACPFLRTEGQDLYSCIIYQSRPGHCRTFSCKPKKDV